MDKRILLTLALGAMSQVFTHAWEPKGDKIKTVWAEQVTPENVWQSYPRPQLQRAEWINLNGLWKYAVTDQNTSRKNVSFEGKSWSRLRLNHLCPECRKHFFLRIDYGINVSSL